jgi:hypothetical protein
MKVALSKPTYIENLVKMMTIIKIVEDDKFFWRNSIHDDTIVYQIDDWIDDVYPGLLLETSNGHHVFVRREITGTSYSDQFRIEDWTDTDWECGFDPSNGGYGLSRNCENMFTGGFMDACKYVLDFWMSRE